MNMGRVPLERSGIYGDVECSTTTICNICGNNYYDPNGACSHWERNSYGGTVCAG